MALTPPVWLFPALSTIGALLGGLFGAYLSKRGEIRAIHANLDKVLEQNKALTASAESIKQDISDRFWTKQRHWEMKKEVIFAVAKDMSTAWREMETMWSYWNERNTDGSRDIQKYFAAVDTLSYSWSFLRIIASKKLETLVKETGRALLEAPQKPREEFDIAKPKINKMVNEVFRELRKELGIGEEET